MIQFRSSFSSGRLLCFRLHQKMKQWNFKLSPLSILFKASNCNSMDTTTCFLFPQFTILNKFSTLKTSGTTENNDLNDFVVHPKSPFFPPLATVLVSSEQSPQSFGRGHLCPSIVMVKKCLSVTEPHSTPP
ncbi:hypothetical protein AVEN_44238-1 [Araneus ventricosus]|uniref:Uncharacterized protein n=1 Tax=Araneus ventricosus TaxID=182803 RepID=A0A4Y2MHM6_ARAVE|nr:hypothetical protein AVEN_44238-1 [Araneus ventricosus]